jgi:outer membrane protein
MKKYNMTKSNRAMLVSMFILAFQLSYGQQQLQNGWDELMKKAEYKAAKDEINKLSIVLHNRIDMAYAEIANLKKWYDANSGCLAGEFKKQYEDEIAIKTDEAKNLTAKYFGYKGLLFQKREELIKRLQG